MTYQDYMVTCILQRYLLGETDEFTDVWIIIGAEEIALDDWLIYVIEIAYHIGYAHSLLQQKFSEKTYKETKKAVKDNLIKRLGESEDMG